jgi:hypothetical protein
MDVIGSIDNVYTDPDAERNKALSQKFIVTSIADDSPGQSILLSIDESSEAVVKIRQWFSMRNKQIHIAYRKYRIATEKDLPNGLIHTDTVQYHVIISLTPHHERMLDFENVYKAKNSEITNISEIRRSFDPQYDNTIQELCKQVNDKSESQFEIVDTCQLAYNRAIIVDATWFHCPTKGFFGKNRLDGRLIEIYCINILSYMNPLPMFPYVWYFTDVVSETTCTDLVDLVNRKCCENDFLHYRDGLLMSMVQSYMDHIIDCTPELLHLLCSKKGKYSTTVQVSAVKHSKYSNSCWDFPLWNEKATFVMILQLNNNEIGYTLMNHFQDNDTHLIPCSSNSLIVFPHTWLYPIRQSTIGSDDKISLRFLVSLKPCSY